MNVEQLDLIQKALRYYEVGDPIKDVFDSGTLQEEVTIAAFQFVVQCADRIRHTSGKRSHECDRAKSVCERLARLGMLKPKDVQKAATHVGIALLMEVRSGGPFAWTKERNTEEEPHGG